MNKKLKEFIDKYLFTTVLLLAVIFNSPAFTSVLNIVYSILYLIVAILISYVMWGISNKKLSKDQISSIKEKFIKGYEKAYPKYFLLALVNGILLVYLNMYVILTLYIINIGVVVITYTKCKNGAL